MKAGDPCPCPLDGPRGGGHRASKKEQDGQTFYDVQRSYKDKNDEWQTTDNYSLFDVFAAIRCLCDSAAYLTIPDVEDNQEEAPESE